VQHVQGEGSTPHSHHDGRRSVAAGRARARRCAVPLLRADRQERQARVLRHLPAASALRRRGPPEGPVVSEAVGAATRVAGVIGAPVRHSASPALHNAAYAALGLDYVYVAFPVPAGRGADAVRAIPVLGLAGLNVTMPHKADAASACDELTPDAAA